MFTYFNKMFDREKAMSEIALIQYKRSLIKKIVSMPNGVTDPKESIAVLKFKEKLLDIINE